MRQMRDLIGNNMNQLMNKQIKEFHIGFLQLGSNLGHAANDYFLYPIRMLLPAHLGAGRFFYHIYTFFKVEGEEDCGITIDFCRAYPQNSRNNNLINYFESYRYGNEGGLRYQMMTYSDFKNKCFTTFVSHMELIIRKRNPPTINQLLDSICNDSSWRRRDFNLFSKNSQDFVVECIKRLDAVRENYYANFRGYHNLALAHYPFKIIDQLEKNENDSQTNIDKIPIIGPIQESARAIFGLIFN